jgi:RNA polymerase sigma-70 factor (ECF subfamily)
MKIAKITEPVCLRELNVQAVGKVYDDFFPDIYKYVLFRLGDEILAEDIASDVFLCLLEAVRGKRGPKTNLHGWLIGTATHKVNDHLRKRYRQTVVPLSDIDLSDHLNPNLKLEIKEQLKEITQTIKELTFEQQHILSLRFGRGYSLEEIAILMNKKVNAIKALQFRAIKNLNRKIDGQK